MLSDATNMTSAVRNVSQEGRTAGSSGVVSIPGPSGRSRHVQPTANLPNSISPAATAQEHQRLFNYQTSCANTRTQTNKKGKRAPLTWTLKFFCMAKRDAGKPPLSVKECTQLVNAGLGDSSIQFSLSQGTVQCQ